MSDNEEEDRQNRRRGRGRHSMSSSWAKEGKTYNSEEGEEAPDLEGEQVANMWALVYITL